MQALETHIHSYEIIHSYCIQQQKDYLLSPLFLPQKESLSEVTIFPVLCDTC